MLTHFSLCSGIGGIDLAAEWAGFETIGQCEIDEYASKVLAKNFPGVKNYHDIRTVTNARLTEDGIGRGSITLLSAGFPCQPYSLAGKGRGDGDERDLWGEVKRCIHELRPRWFVGENTPGLFARAGQRYFQRILADLTALGYSVSWGIWGACDVGAPHMRKRVFICAHRNADGGHDDTQCEVYAQDFTACGICGKIPDADGDGLGQYGGEKELAETASCGTDYGIRAKENAVGKWWQTEPELGRVADGIPHRVDRLRGLGNAVVPRQVYPLLKAIADYEKDKE